MAAASAPGTPGVPPPGPVAFPSCAPPPRRPRGPASPTRVHNAAISSTPPAPAPAQSSAAATYPMMHAAPAAPISMATFPLMSGGSRPAGGVTRQWSAADPNWGFRRDGAACAVPVRTGSVTRLASGTPPLPFAAATQAQVGRSQSAAAFRSGSPARQLSFVPPPRCPSMSRQSLAVGTPAGTPVASPRGSRAPSPRATQRVLLQASAAATAVNNSQMSIVSATPPHPPQFSYVPAEQPSQASYTPPVVQATPLPSARLLAYPPPLAVQSAPGLLASSAVTTPQGSYVPPAVVPSSAPQLQQPHRSYTPIRRTPSQASYTPLPQPADGSIPVQPVPIIRSGAAGCITTAPLVVAPLGSAPLRSVPPQVGTPGVPGLPFAATSAAPSRASSVGPLVRQASVSRVAPQPPAQQLLLPVQSARDVRAGERLSPGAEVTIGAFHLRCKSVLGRGSFSEVWSAEVLAGPAGFVGREVALKDNNCSNDAELRHALFECSLLELLKSPDLRIPMYLSHRVDPAVPAVSSGGSSGSRSVGGSQTGHVRLAMTRVPGENIDNFLKRLPAGAQTAQEAPNAVRRGCALARQLVRQVAPALDRLSRHAWHRDVNSHNVLVSDRISGGDLHYHGDPEEMGRRASFWLIDFGLAVDSTTWPSVWPTSDVAGDCRYWGASSFLMSFCGPDETAARKDFCQQYLSRLDIVGLALTALEVLCATALVTAPTWGKEGLRGSWRRLFMRWEKYRDEVTRWHHKIYEIFASGDGASPLYRQLAEERIVERIIEHQQNLRLCLRACVQRAEDVRIQSLLAVLADMLDEQSSITLAQAVEQLGGPDVAPSAMASPGDGKMAAGSMIPHMPAQRQAPIQAHPLPMPSPRQQGRVEPQTFLMTTAMHTMPNGVMTPSAPPPALPRRAPSQDARFALPKPHTEGVHPVPWPRYGGA
eukprot:TRINITY_DN394_c1_g1_i3.p1 TRINITY_DN394_c1_g1~~TRINITY_DN394_c1_g1_i3.p1  ORF type:complete len:932 (+),score=162.72 TRINITY_DN394_c1_g1_i3:100-2895(+)